MAPRTTRNSNGLRSPVVPRRAARPRAPVRSAKAPPAATAASMSTEAGDEDDEYYSKKIKWLKCRDQYGVPVIVKYSDTGEGVHMIWNWSEFEDEEASNAMDEDEDVMEDDVATPPPTAFEKVLNTPQQQHPYDAGSVLRTPVKKAKPLRPSRTRLGDRGIYGGCERPGFYREVNGDYRMILNHDVGSLVNLSREQVEEQQIVDDHKIFVVQLQKLMAETEALTREDMGIIPAGGCGDVAMDEVPAKRRVQTAGPAGDKMAGPDATTGPNGEKLDRQGRRMLGPEGTILVDPTFGPKRRTRLPAPREIPEEEEVEVPVRKTPRRGPPRRVQLIARPLGPEATEICHY